MRLRLSAAVLLATLAGCVERAPPPPPAPPRPTPTPLPPPPPPLAEDWRDWPLTPGSWVYARDGRGTRAMFGPTNADALLVLRCDTGERRVYLSRAGAGTAPLALRTSSTARSLPVQPTGGAQPYVAASLAPSDPLLDAIAFSRGRFVVEQTGAATLVVPVYAEIGRVIEDCR